MNTTTLPFDLVPPQNGIHRWLLATANRLRHHLPAEEAVARLLAATSDARRRVPLREVSAAVNQAYSDIGRAVSGHDPPWPPVDQQRRAQVIRTGVELHELWRSSPVKVGLGCPDTEQFVDWLFPEPNPLLCVSRTKFRAVTKRREFLRGRLREFRFIVPSPMSAPRARTRDGRMSERTLENTGPRRYLVCESDYEGASLDDHCAVVGHLALYLPLVMVVFSGGKSLHAWYSSAGKDEPWLRRFFSYAVSLGCDPITWTPCQLVRMPAGRRDTGAEQPVYYFNPNHTN
jgi:hypothetical protein